MNKEEIEYFGDSKVKLSLKNDFTYRGKITKIFSSALIIDDFKRGELMIPFEEIRSVQRIVDAKDEQ